MYVFSKWDTVSNSVVLSHAVDVKLCLKDSNMCQNICSIRDKMPKMQHVFSACVLNTRFWYLQHGADPTKKNRDGNTPLDLVKDGDTDIQDLLRGDAALLDAAKKGCLARVKKLCSPDNVNCRDTQGRHSTPLHLAGQCFN